MPDNALFPLPICPFEFYMISDERPGYPMTIPFRFGVRGTIDRDAFCEALHETVDANPLLKSVIGKVRHHGLCWQLVEDWETPIHWNEGNPGLELDIRRQPGLKVWVRSHGDQTQIDCVVHHACMDGIGVFRFVGDWLAAYARRTAAEGQATVRQKPLDARLLRQRSHFPVELPEPIGAGTIVRETLREAYRWLTRPATPLAPMPVAAPAATDPQSVETLDYLWAILSADEVQQYRQTASSLEVTLNDLLIRDMFLTILSWNDTHRPRRPGRWLRITMPTNLRMRMHRRMPVANGISYAFLTRRADECQAAESLLAGIHDETTFIKDWHVSLMFLDAIKFARRIPFATWFMSRNSRRCFSTTNLSYLGEFPRLFRQRLPRREDGTLMAGNLSLEYLYGAPPVRPQTHATLAVVGYRGELSFCMRVNRAALPLPAGRMFLDHFLSEMRHTIDAGR